MTIAADDSVPSSPEATRSPLAMSAPERMAFLAGDHVGIVVHGRADGAPPAASPVWYRYEPGGDVAFVTGARSEKAKGLAMSPGMTFLVQQEAHPQKFVAVSGDARVARGAEDDVRRSIAGRYIPEDALDQFVAMTPGDQLVTVSMTPRNWRSSDFGKLSAGQ